jgi:hypothetical protein
MENAKTKFGTAIEAASQAFGASFVAKVLGLIKADWKTERAFFEATIEAQPLAVAVGYSILRAIENANDTPERDWDEVFGATLSSYFDDLDMLYSSGLAWGLYGESWQAFALTIRTYDATGKADKATRLDLSYRGAESFHNLALRAYNLSPNRWTLGDLQEAAESLFDLERYLDALQDSDFEQPNAKKGL